MSGFAIFFWGGDCHVKGLGVMLGGWGHVWMHLDAWGALNAGQMPGIYWGSKSGDGGRLQ